jgi:hypothetical protein
MVTHVELVHVWIGGGIVTMMASRLDFGKNWSSNFY